MKNSGTFCVKPRAEYSPAIAMNHYDAITRLYLSLSALTAGSNTLPLMTPYYFETLGFILIKLVFFIYSIKQQKNFLLGKLTK